MECGYQVGGKGSKSCFCFCVCLHTAHGARRLPAVPTKPHGCSINQINNQPPIRITERFLAGRANSWRLTPCKSTMVKVEGETEKNRLRMYVVQHDRIRANGCKRWPTSEHGRITPFEITKSGFYSVLSTYLSLFWST